MSTVNPADVATTATSSTSQTNKPQDAFGKDAFMKLLVEQLRHQSPDNSQDPNAFINQMTQFSILEQLQNQTATDSRASAATYLGRTVTWQNAKGQGGQGVVQGVDFSGDTPTLTVDGQGGIATTDVLDVR
jgi:flagellar basal-body rod modification protein FlgD